MEEERPTVVEINSYLDNLNEEGLRQLASQLLDYPDRRTFIYRCIKEFNKFYKMLRENQNG